MSFCTRKRKCKGKQKYDYGGREVMSLNLVIGPEGLVVQHVCGLVTMLTKPFTRRDETSRFQNLVQPYKFQNIFAS